MACLCLALQSEAVACDERSFWSAVTLTNTVWLSRPPFSIARRSSPQSVTDHKLRDSRGKGSLVVPVVSKAPTGPTWVQRSYV